MKYQILLHIRNFGINRHQETLNKNSFIFHPMKLRQIFMACMKACDVIMHIRSIGHCKYFDDFSGLYLYIVFGLVKNSNLVQ